MSREFLFISHANPEDNAFTRWLALQLAKVGYPVWCDLTEYLGGEDAWRDADKVIKEKACKFLFVLSKTSNDKDGVLKELMIAENIARINKLKDFIIPLRIDDLLQEEVNIQLARLVSIDFSQGWALGLNTLLEKLEREHIEKNVSYNPQAVTEWWRSNFSAEGGVSQTPEDCLSNWFSITSLPDKLYTHTLTRGENGIGPLDLTTKPPFPGFLQGINLVTFAKSDDFIGHLGELSIEQTKEYLTATLLGSNPPGNLGDRNQCRDIIIRLLTIAWGDMVSQRALPVAELANERQCFYFPSGLCGTDNKVFITGVDGQKTYRQMVGFASISKAGQAEKAKRYWHFGVQGYPMVYPEIAFVLKSHIVFSDDGQNVWVDKKKMHKARRSQSKNWWNDAWRDRLLCATSWLAGENDISLTLGSDVSVHISSQPIIFTSPVSYVLNGEYSHSESNEPIISEEFIEEDDDETGDY